jgi:predicted TPR repeat methyltransferase
MKRKGKGMTMEEFGNYVNRKTNSTAQALKDDAESVEDKLTYSKEVSKVWFVEGDAEVAVFNTQAAAEEWKQVTELKGKVVFRNILTMGDLNGG